MTGGAPGRVAPARQRSGTAISGIASLLIAAASGGDFRAHAGASQENRGHRRTGPTSHVDALSAR